MQSKAKIQEQQNYQKKLLQQQQQQMSQFHNMAASTDNGGHLTLGTPAQQVSVGAPFPMTPRHALPNAAMMTSRMGPPNHLGIGSTSSNMSSQQYSASPSGSESTSHLGPGAGLARLHQYSEALKEGPDRHTSGYWKSFVDEFFLPESSMHLVLWNPSTHEHKGFEVPASVVARWMQTNYISGVVSSSLSLEGPREYMSGQPFPPPPRSIRADFHLPSGNVTHFVECKRSLLINNFENGWQVQMNGLIRAALVPHTKVLPPTSVASKDELPTLQTHLRFECLEILIMDHRSFIPSMSSFIKSQEERIPLDIVREILSAHGVTDESDTKSAKTEGGSTAGDVASKKDFSIKVNQVCLPDSPVNEYGITLRAMRCLEITESVCQLRDLMDFSMKDKDRNLGPLDGLRRLTAQYRERDSQMQRQGLTPSNALQFDTNNTQQQQTGQIGTAEANGRPAANALNTAGSAATSIDGSPTKKQQQQR